MFDRILDFAFPALCVGCRRTESALCAACFPVSGPFVHATATLEVRALGEYTGALRAAVVALKSGRRDVARTLAERIAVHVQPGITIVPVPTTAARRRVRGFDGVVTIASLAAAWQSATVLCALECVGDGMQRGRGRAQRLAARNRFTVRSQVLDGMRCVLLDDVCTTGATLEDCANALRRAGATVSQAFVLAVANREA